MDRRDVRPLVLRDVPAQRLAFRFEPDIGMPADVKLDESDEKLATIQTDFTTRRPDDALLRTVVSPDGQRALALYGTETEPSPNFRIDLYAVDGKFLRKLTPPDLSCVFPETVAWSGDGNLIAFIAHRSAKPAPTPTPPPGVALPEATPEEASQRRQSTRHSLPLPLLVQNKSMFAIAMVMISSRLTSREGLIYFYFAWAPDSHALVALACRESEWAEREKAYKLPAGRPRLITLDGKERLLDDS